MSEKWIVTYRGTVHPWLCDSQWHMNTRHHAAMFDDASWQVLGMIGYRNAMAKDDNFGWAEVRHLTEFKREAPVGVMLRVESTIAKIGTSSLTIQHRMVSLEDESEVATFEGISVAFDLVKRRSRPLPEAFKAKAFVIFENSDG